MAAAVSASTVHLTPRSGLLHRVLLQVHRVPGWRYWKVLNPPPAMTWLSEFRSVKKSQLTPARSNCGSPQLRPQVVELSVRSVSLPTLGEVCSFRSGMVTSFRSGMVTSFRSGLNVIFFRYG